MSSFYTKQAEEDALVTQITNPNRVGSGFIDLGPQKRFASSSPNWQTSGSTPADSSPLTDIRNSTQRQSSNGSQPTSEAAVRQARAARFAKEAKKPPPPLPKNRMAHPGGKIVTSDKDAALAALLTRKTKAGVPLTAEQQRTLQNRAKGAVAPAAVPVDPVAALAGQLAEDEALARQLQQQMLQHAPPEPVAVVAEQPPPEPVAAPAKKRTDAAKHVAPAPQPAAKPPAPAPEATTEDTTAKRVRALRKKVRDIDLLEEKQREGAVLQQEQLDKIAAKAAIVKELGALAGGLVEKDKEAGATTDDTTAKRVRALRKKVRDIDLLEEKQREGAVLEPNQLVKIAAKAAIVKELGALLLA